MEPSAPPKGALERMEGSSHRFGLRLGWFARRYQAEAALVGLVAAIVLILGSWYGPERAFGRISAVLVLVWGAGLAALVLGAVRDHSSRFGLKTLFLATFAIAITFGVGRACGPGPAILTWFLLTSYSMIRVAWSCAAAGPRLPNVFRQRWALAIMRIGGLCGMGVCGIFVTASLAQAIFRRNLFD